MGREYKQVEFGQIVIMLIQLMLHLVADKQSGIGRETHKMMLNHYRQNKNLHVSYSEKNWVSFNQ